MADKYTMQILDGNGRIVKSETFSELWEGEIRTITLLPSEKEYLDVKIDKNKRPWVNYILESRGLEKLKDSDEATVKDGILTISKKG